MPIIKSVILHCFSLIQTDFAEYSDYLYFIVFHTRITIYSRHIRHKICQRSVRDRQFMVPFRLSADNVSVKKRTGFILRPSHNMLTCNSLFCRTMHSADNCLYGLPFREQYTASLMLCLKDMVVSQRRKQS